ncbi:MAG: S1 RNA-binding domain-containing protein [Anaerolineae bacterium]|nr:S1 RNA-binding domain-containing protein [Anaerolineae bacterium]
MSTSLQRQEIAPPPIEEGYWKALLAEGEFAEPIQAQPDTSLEQTSTVDDPLIHDDHYEAQTYDQIDTEESDWERISQIMGSDEVIDLPVIGYNRGGLLVEWRSLRGFVPASQLIDFPATINSTARRNALIERVGQTLQLRVIEISSEQSRLILSERAAQVEAGERAQILTHLKPGDRVTGQVTNLCDFGAFVDLGGLEGLIHISELSWGRVGHPADMLQREQEIEVYVLNVDKANGRIALSLKRLHPDPWETVSDRYQIGQMVDGTVTNVVDFGAFACIEEGLEGLIHVSELAEGHFLHPRNVVTEGQSVHARILSIDSSARRLGLSLRLGE